MHLGVGNFFRSHLAFYTDRFLRNEHGHDDAKAPSWMIHGVGLLDHPAEAQLHADLASQDLVYGLLSMPSGDARAIGSLAELTHTPSSPAATQAALAAIAAPTTRIVSSTVTEKGYCHDPNSEH